MLTRLPPPHRAESGVVRDWLVQRFAGRFLVLSAVGEEDRSEASNV